VNLSADAAYTVAAVGALENINAAVLEDDLSQTPGGTARVSVYHFSPDAPAVDVKLTDGTVLAGSLEFPNSTSFEVPAGTYDIIVTPAGEADPVVIDLAGTTLEEGVFYKVAATDFLDSITPQVSTVSVGTSGAAPEQEETPEPEPTPAPEQPAPTGTAQVSVVHASPDAPAVDVYVDGSAVLTNVPFFTASDYLDVPAGERQIAITPAGQPEDQAVLSGSFTLNADAAYTVAAIGLLANIDAVSLVDNLSPTASGEGRLSVFHFSPDAPAVDVKLADGTVLGSNISFGSGFEIDVPAGTYDVQVTPAGEDSVVLDLPGVTINAGEFLSVYAVGELANINAQTKVTQIGTEAPAPGQPAPTPAPEQPDVPIQLPETAGTTGVPVAALALGALALIGMGGALAFGLRRRS
jgi:hypothetical protein